MQRIDTDVLVIGAGAAGIRAALAASEAGVDVMIVANGPVAQVGSTFSPITKGWGIQTLVGNERTDQNLESFYSEIIRVGLGKCDPKLVRILVEESGPRFNDLLSYGIRFKRDTQDNFLRVKGCFSDVERAYITDDFQNLKQSFRSMLSKSNIKFLKGRIIDLITKDHSCWGALIQTESKNVIQVNSKSTIIATGGAAGLFMDNLVGQAEMGDGYALAFRAGAELTNLEFIQFVLGLKNKGTRNFLSPSELQTPGVLMNSDGVDIIQKHIPDDEIRQQSLYNRLTHVPFSCRDTSYLMDTALAKERGEGGKVYFKPNKSEPPDEVVHFAHAFNGGVVINEFAESTAIGLYAAGEVAAGPHGADRIGGCMMTATQVFGERAGRFAALRAKRIGKSPDTIRTPWIIKKIEDQSQCCLKEDKLLSLKKRIRKIYSRNMMILRHKDGLNACLQDIKATDAYIDKIEDVDSLEFLNFKNMLQVMQLTCLSALNREKSLGSHFRTDSAS